MRLPPSVLALLLVGLSCRAQDANPGPGDGNMQGPDASPYPVAQPAGPDAAQDAEAAREAKLRSEDQVQIMESNSEANRVALEAMKNDISQLQAANATLKQQLADLQASMDKAERDRAKERDVLVEEVAKLVAARGGEETTPAPRRHHVEEESVAESASDSTEVHGHGGESAAGEASDGGSSDRGGTGDASDHSAPSVEAPAEASLAPPPDDPPPPKPQKGYYHVVEKGETLSMICAAYRDEGVKVSVGEVRKANGLAPGGTLKVGQKLFIPKPGT